MKIKYNKEEFEKNAKELAEEHGIPLDVMKQWLHDSYNKIAARYEISKKDIFKKRSSEELKKELTQMIDNDVEWICPFCETINAGETCSGCGAYLDKENNEK